MEEGLHVDTNNVSYCHFFLSSTMAEITTIAALYDVVELPDMLETSLCLDS